MTPAAPSGWVPITLPPFPGFVRTFTLAVVLTRLPNAITEATDGAGVDLVFDGVGRDTFAGSLASVAPFGRLVTFGHSSGAPDPIALEQPFYGDNKSIIGYSTGGNRRWRPESLRAPAAAVIKLMAQGRWKPLISARYPLAQAGIAHQVVEDRDSVGKVLLIP